MKPFKRFGITILFLFAAVSEASTYNVSGRIIRNSNGAPLEASNVIFQFEVLSPSGTCTLYRERTTLDMTGSNGFFSASLGNGTRDNTVGAPSALVSLPEIISNRSTNLPCDGGAFFNPITDDTRSLRISFNDGAGWQVFSQQTLKNVPYASEATNSLNSAKVGSFSADQLLRTSTPIAPLTATQLTNLLNFSAETASSFLKTESDPTVMSFAKTALPTCATGETLKSDGTSFTCVTSTGAIPSLSGDVTGSIIANTVSKIQGTMLSATPPTFGNVLTFNGVQWTPANVNAVTSITAGPGLDGGTITSSGTISLPPTPVTPGTYGSATTIPVIAVDTYGRLVSATTAAVPVTSVAGRSGAITLGYNDIQSATSSYLTYKPNNIACAQGQTLSYDTTKPGWVCATSLTTETDPKVAMSTVNALAKWNGTQLTNGQIFENAGKVGIGTTTPAATLHITGTAGSALRIQDGTQGAGKVLTSNALGTTAWSSTGGDLAGSYETGPTVVGLNSYPLPTSGYQNGDMLVLNAGEWTLRKKNSCAAGWNAITDYGAPFCIKKLDATTRVVIETIKDCGTQKADLCSLSQLAAACRSNQLAVNDVVWSNVVLPTQASAVTCVGSGNYNLNAYDPVTARSAYCCQPAMNNSY